MSIDSHWSTADATPDLLHEWVDGADRMDRMLAPYGARLLDRAAPSRGERVLDVGCGTGATTAAVWSRVAPDGTVHGVDIAEALLAAARSRLAALPPERVGLLRADAQTHRFAPGGYDLVVSRFGTAHFPDPTAALCNLRAALRPGGRLVVVEWADPAANEWMTLADRVGARTLGARWVTQGTSGHDSAFANPARLCEMLARAGLDVESVVTVAEPMNVGATVGEVLTWFTRLPDSRPFRLLHGEEQRRVLDALGAELRDRATPAGVLLGATARLVAARRPGPTARSIAAVAPPRGPSVAVTAGR